MELSTFAIEARRCPSLFSFASHSLSMYARWPISFHSVRSTKLKKSGVPIGYTRIVKMAYGSQLYHSSPSQLIE